MNKLIFCSELIYLVKENQMKIKTILWDWNGTLLNDVSYAHDIVNNILKKRGIKNISIEKYRKLFTIPLIDYYKNIGLDFNTEDEYISTINEFNTLFMVNVDQCDLCVGAKDTLEFCLLNGIEQYILSGLNDRDLQKQVSLYNIDHFFKEIRGSNHNDASDKLENAQKLLKENSINIESTIYVGDTMADFELSKSIGCSFIFFDGGHQKILNDKNIVVAGDMSDLKKIIGDLNE